MSPLNNAGQWANLQQQQPFFPVAVSQSSTQQFIPPLGGTANNQVWQSFRMLVCQFQISICFHSFLEISCSHGMYLLHPQCKGIQAHQCHIHTLMPQSLPMRLYPVLFHNLLLQKLEQVEGKNFPRYFLVLILFHNHLNCVHTCMCIFVVLPLVVVNAGSVHCKIFFLPCSSPRLANGCSPWHGYLNAIQ